MKKNNFWKKIKNKWMQKMIEQWDYPIKTKAVHCDIWIGFICFFVGGFIIGSSLTTEIIPIADALVFIAFGFSIILIGFYNFHYWTFRQMKAYENRYGKTGLGEQFKNNWESKKGFFDKIFM